MRGALRVDWPDNYKHKEPACERVLLPQPGARATRLVENGICEACKRRSDINPKNVLIAAALIVYIGVNVAAYIKDHPPRELTAEQREKIAEGQRLATRAAMMAGYVD